MKKTIITAHSGCEGTAPNSMDHIRTALTCGAEMLEIDVRQTEDGLLYLSHDLPQDPPGSCVRFGDFLDLLKESPSVRVNCDMKQDGHAAAVMEEAVLSLSKPVDAALLTAAVTDAGYEVKGIE